MEPKGYIYKITNSENNKVYIGQTKKSSNWRFKDHITNAKRWNTTHTSSKGTCTRLYDAMGIIGYDNFSYEQLEEVDIPNLDEREAYYIEQYNAVDDGYNQKYGGDKSKHCAETKERIATTALKNMEQNLDKYRKHDEIKDMPMYVIYAKIKGYPAICINNHPKCSRKSFVARDGKTIEECKVEALAFLEQLKISDTVYKAHDKGDLPKGVNKKGKGYEVRKIINGNFHYKSFADQSKTDEENKSAAINYLKLITENVQRLSVSRSLQDELQEILDLFKKSCDLQQENNEKIFINLAKLIDEAQDIVRPT
jgi:group I intron endonuclease